MKSPYRWRIARLPKILVGSAGSLVGVFSTALSKSVTDSFALVDARFSRFAIEAVLANDGVSASSSDSTMIFRLLTGVAALLSLANRAILWVLDSLG